MPRALVLAALLLLPACSNEPSFDERYDKAEKQIRAKAADIDRQLQAEPGDRRPAT